VKRGWKGPRFRTGIGLAWLLVSVLPVVADAQGRDQPPALEARHVTVSGGVIWTGGYAIGDATAELRGNAIGPTAPPFTLFAADTTIDATAGFEARVGFAVTRDLTIETGFSYQRPGLTTELSQDAEAEETTIEAEQLAQYVVDVAVVWQIPGVSIGKRMRPFVSGGGGYLRQLYDERTLVETGSVYYAGGGVRYWLRGGDGQRRSVGIRADARVQWRRDGVEFENKTRAMPVIGVLVFTEF
jgi:hypothetical protein